VEYISSYHYIRIIDGPTNETDVVVVGFNGNPNQSIRWVKAMSID
jgi:hypothetical protein